MSKCNQCDHNYHNEDGVCGDCEYTETSYFEYMELPSYYPEGMGCGIEDNGITDRYQACEYGYETAVEDCNNDVITPLKDDLIAKNKEIQKLKEKINELMDTAEVDRLKRVHEKQWCLCNMHTCKKCHPNWVEGDVPF